MNKILRIALSILLLGIITFVVGAKGCFWWRDKNNNDTITGSSGTLPAQVTSPYPVNGATYLPINEQLSWATANGAISYDVYFGTTYTGWTPVTNTTGTSYKVGTLFASITYYWRVDSKNAVGITIGNIWSFRFDSVANLTVGTPFRIPPAGHDDVYWPADIAYGNGKYFAVWRSEHTGTKNVYGRVVNMDGSLGPVIDIATDASYNETVAAVAYNDTAKKWLVVYGVWQSGVQLGQYGRILSDSGMPIGAAFNISSPTPYRVSVVPIPNGFYVVVTLDYNIYGQVVNLDGSLGSLVEIVANNMSGYPWAAYAPALGKIFVVWQDGRTGVIEPIGLNGISIYGRFLDATGSPLGDEFVVIPDAPQWANYPTVEYNSGDNTFIVGWVEYSEDPAADVWLQRFDANGVPIGSAIRVNDQNLGSERGLDIAYNPVIGKSLVVWWVDTDMTKVKARSLNADGTFEGLQFDIPGTHQPFVASSRVTDEFIVHGADGVIIKVPSQ